MDFISKAAHHHKWIGYSIALHLIRSIDSSLQQRIAVLIVNVQGDAGECGEAAQSRRDRPVEQQGALRLSQIVHCQKPLDLFGGNDVNKQLVAYLIYMAMTSSPGPDWRHTAAGRWRCRRLPESRTLFARSGRSWSRKTRFCLLLVLFARLDPSRQHPLIL